MNQYESRQSIMYTVLTFQEGTLHHNIKTAAGKTIKAQLRINKQYFTLNKTPIWDQN